MPRKTFYLTIIDGQMDGSIVRASKKIALTDAEYLYKHPMISQRRRLGSGGQVSVMEVELQETGKVEPFSTGSTEDLKN
jgi:hypothetical protein